jgi:hypothetical protein
MIIGICGKAGAGKSTVADFLVRDHGFVAVALADPLKRICRDVFDFTDEQLWGPSEKRNAPDTRYVQRRVSKEIMRGDPPEVVCEYLTPRHALQQLGTEWGRSCYPNVWIDYALRVAARMNEGGHTYSAQRGLNSFSLTGSETYAAFERSKRSVVISDVRFRNEVDAIRAAGGVVWRIDRPGAGLTGSAAAHASETEQDGIPVRLFHVVLNNGNKSLEQLRQLVGIAVGTVTT